MDEEEKRAKQDGLVDSVGELDKAIESRGNKKLNLIGGRQDERVAGIQ